MSGLREVGETRNSDGDAVWSWCVCIHRSCSGFLQGACFIFIWRSGKVAFMSWSFGPTTILRPELKSRIHQLLARSRGGQGKVSGFRASRIHRRKITCRDCSRGVVAQMGSWCAEGAQRMEAFWRRQEGQQDTCTPPQGWSLNGSLGRHSGCSDLAFFQEPGPCMDTQCDSENSPRSSSRGKIKKILIVLPYL